MTEVTASRKKPSKAWYYLLLIPFIFALWPASYSMAAPALWGFPFFYWYQILWILLTALISYIVYAATKD